MFRNIIIKTSKDIWPIILVFSIVIISLRLIYLNKSNKKILLYKEILNFSFIIYIIFLFRIVTFSDVTWSTSNFIPFKEIFRYDFGSKLFFKNVIGNMIMFIPFGFFISYFLKLKKPIIPILLTLLVSFIIEFVQNLIGRVFDIDDIFLNTIGGLIGYMICYLLSKVKFNRLLQKEWFYNIIIVLIIILIILYLLGVLYV